MNGEPLYDEAGDELIPPGDPRIPEAIREHALRFRAPVVYIVDLGHGDYALLGKDGEVVDVAWLKR